MFRSADAGDARHARQPAGLRDETAGVARGDGKAGARDGAGGTGGNAGGVAARATVADRRPRREIAIDDDQRAVRPPRPEHGMDLQPEGPRPAQPDRAPEPLKRNQRLCAVEGKENSVADAERGERLRRCRLGDALGVTVERMGRAVARFGAGARKPIEERRSARADDDRRLRAREQAVERQRRDRGAGPGERGWGERRDDVQSPAAQRALERREDRRFAVRRLLRRAGLPITIASGRRRLCRRSPIAGGLGPF